MYIVAIASIENENGTLKIRLLDGDTGEVKEIQIENIANAIKVDNIQISNLELDNKGLNVSDKSINRLPKIIRGKLVGKSPFIIISQLEGIGYKLVDYKGSTITLPNDRVVMCAETQGLVNGEVQIENGIKTIKGNFKFISKEEINKSKQILKVIGYKDKYTGNYINTTSRSSNWSKGLSPFFLPCDIAKNVENGWQYSKVYPEHADEDGNPTEEYFKWAQEGFNKTKAARYPMGKGRRPLYSYLNGEKLSYTEARRKIYIPLYAKAVVKSDAFKYLKGLYDTGEDIILWDFDGYDHEKLKMTLDEVIDSPRRKMGHAFVIMMLLVGKIEVINDEVIIH